MKKIFFISVFVFLFSVKTSVLAEISLSDVETVNISLSQNGHIYGEDNREITTQPGFVARLFIWTPDGKSHFCGGTVVNEDNAKPIVTAAHCLYDKGVEFVRGEAHFPHVIIHFQPHHTVGNKSFDVQDQNPNDLARIYVFHKETEESLMAVPTLSNYQGQGMIIGSTTAFQNGEMISVVTKTNLCNFWKTGELQFDGQLRTNCDSTIGTSGSGAFAVINGDLYLIAVLSYQANLVYKSKYADQAHYSIPKTLMATL